MLNFGERLKSFGINVRELTGDNQLSKEQIASTQARPSGSRRMSIRLMHACGMAAGYRDHP